MHMRDEQSKLFKEYHSVSRRDGKYRENVSKLNNIISNFVS